MVKKQKKDHNNWMIQKEEVRRNEKEANYVH